MYPDLRRITLYFSVFIVLAFIAWSCANPVAPTGGPKDVEPPVILRSVPPDRSLNFKGEKITIYFNEFVTLKEMMQQLIVSPPLNQTPEFKVRGRSLEILFKEPLRDETTYSMYMGDAIVDITEANPITGYKFTFSTGNVLDSMMINGRLVNAFDLTPVSAAYVMLYDSIYDSVPYKQIPYYISRTNESGEFELTNLRNIPYKIFALSDANANYIFDIPSEGIAFLDYLIDPWFETASSNAFILGADSAKIDVSSTKSEVDSVLVTIQADSMSFKKIQSDTLVQIPDSIMHSEDREDYVQLFHFKEVDSAQSIIKSNLIKENVINMIFKYPVKVPQFHSLIDSTILNPVVVTNKIHDTLSLWFPGYSADSIRMVVKDAGAVIDTVELSAKPPERINRNKETIATPKIGISTNLVSSKIKPNQSLRLTFTDPLISLITDSLKLIEDSLAINNFSTEFADSAKKQLIIKHSWKPGYNYTFIIPDSISEGVMGFTNDSTAFKFTAYTEEETSKISLNVVLETPQPYIIQLLDPKEKLIEQYFISESTHLEFNYLNPGKYKVKAIVDANANGYWDTGKYLINRYPEKVLYYNKEFELRANWAVEEEWLIR